MKIALVQSKPYQTLDESLSKGIEYCKLAKLYNSDLVLFPEMWSVGYTLPQNENEIDSWKKLAINIDSEYINEFKKFAQNNSINICITFLESTDTLPKNSLAIINKNGEIVSKYSKVHTCDFSNEKFCLSGDSFNCCEIDTSDGLVKVGSIICFDREFPESVRELMLQGAEIVIIPNACEIESNRKNQLQTRAFENMLGIALANYTGEGYFGHSIAFDGMAFRKDESSRNHLVIEAGESDGIYIADFNIAELRSYRKREVWGDAYRKVNTYKNLLKTSKNEVFYRYDSK